MVIPLSILVILVKKHGQFTEGPDHPIRDPGHPC